MTTSKRKKNNKLIISIIGMTLLIIGVTCILMWWQDVVALCKGSGGMILAITGLFILYSIKD